MWYDGVVFENAQKGVSVWFLVTVSGVGFIVSEKCVLSICWIIMIMPVWRVLVCRLCFCVCFGVIANCEHSCITWYDYCNVNSSTRIGSFFLECICEFVFFLRQRMAPHAHKKKALYFGQFRAPWRSSCEMSVFESVGLFDSNFAACLLRVCSRMMCSSQKRILCTLFDCDCRTTEIASAFARGEFLVTGVLPVLWYVVAVGVISKSFAGAWRFSWFGYIRGCVRGGRFPY